ncbi:MAG: hypothetical protein EBZ49_12200 [Proteobacteria bacterium]|nr:hypothetical protein [Pseudomonadota bacterium]
MKMNKEDMAKMEMEPGEGMAHEKAEGPAYEKKEDVMEGESEDVGEDSDWKANCDANDLLRAAEIKADPARMKAALEILGQKKKAIDSMEELMAVRKDKMMKKES